MIVKAFLFDTFGTIVDQCSSLAREIAAVANAHDIANCDDDRVASTWRAGYRPGMAKVKAGIWPWVWIVVTHRKRLDEI